MTTFTEKAIRVFEDSIFRLVSTPSIDLDEDALQTRVEAIHNMSLKILKMETSNMEHLQKALKTQGAKLEQALKALEEATKANTDAMTFIHSTDHFLQMISSIVPLF